MSVLSADAADREIACFKVFGGASLEAAAGAAMRETAIGLGVGPADAESLRAATESLCSVVAAQAAEEVRGAIEVTLIDRPGAIVIRIDDPGIPWRTEAMGITGASTIGRLLRDHAIDELHIRHRGRRGNRAEIVRRLPNAPGDVREHLSAADHEIRIGAAAVPPDAPVEIRQMRTDDAEALARCVYMSYGYSYDADWIYDSSKIARMIDSGRLISFVGVAADGEIVGHMALLRPTAESLVVEGGQAVVDPRYRGHHLFTTLKRRATEWATNAGLNGIYSEATAAHPYSQKANLDLGAHETGLLLGYIPSSVHYRGMDTVADGHRRSVVLYYLKTGEALPRPVYAPDRHRAMVERIIREGGLHGSIERPTRAPAQADRTALDVVNRRDHNQGIIEVRTFGLDFIDTVGGQLRDLCDHGLDCIYADLPLSDPNTEILGGDLEELGFFFGGVFPNRRAEGDILRLQYLNGVEVSCDDVDVASDLGKTLLDYVLGSKPTNV